MKLLTNTQEDYIELRYMPEIKIDSGWIKLNNAFPIPLGNSHEFDYNGKRLKINLIIEEIE